MTALLAILVIAVVVGVVGYPLLRPSAAGLTIPLGPITALKDRKLQIYAGIRELGFDYRMDKLEESDYEVEVERLKSEAVSVVQQIYIIDMNHRLPAHPAGAYKGQRTGPQ